MYVDIVVSEDDVGIELQEPYDFTVLQVLAPPGWTSYAVGELLARERAGRPAGAGHVWLCTAGLRRWASRRVGDTWESGLIELLESARLTSSLTDDGAEVLAPVGNRPAPRR